MHEGVTYCRQHATTLIKTKSPTSSVPGPSSFNFIPDPNIKEEKNPLKTETPSHITAMFKQFDVEKCMICQKTVYSTEKITFGDLKQQQIFHKACLKCSHCGIKLDVSTYGSSNNVIYCKVHLKEFGKPEQAKSDNAYFVSPLRNESEYTPQYENPREGSKQSEFVPKQDVQQQVSRMTINEDTPKEVEVMIREEQSEEVQREEVQTEDSFSEESEEDRRKKEREERRRKREAELSENTEVRDSGEMSEEDREKRKKEREQRKKEREDQDRKEQEESDRRAEERAEERKKRMEELRN